MKRSVSFLLIAAMLFAMLPFSAISAFAAESEVTDSQGVTYGLSNDGTYYCVSSCDWTAISIVIPAEINGLPVKEIGSWAFAGCTSLTSIEISNSVTSIGGYAFYYCTSLTSIEIPNSVTGIGSYAFYDCTSLTEIIVDENNPHYSSVNGVLFNKDKTELVFYPKGKTETTYVIPEGVMSIDDYVFDGYTSLKSIAISDSVTYIGLAVFANWTDEQTIYICAETQPDGWDSDWAAGCGANIVWGYNGDDNPDPTPEPEVTDSQGVTYGLSNDGTYYYVSGCDWTAISIVIPAEINGLPVKEISGYAFNSTSLKSIVISGSVTRIGANAFRNCTSLTNVVIPAGVTSIGELAFYDCTSLTEIIVDENNPHYSSANGVLFNKDKTELVFYPEGKTETTYVIPAGVTSIGDYAFLGSTSLTSIVIPEGVKSIGESAFVGCASLTNIEIPGSVTSIGNHALQECTSLASIVISEGVTSIGNYAFLGSTSLTSIEIPESVTYIGWDAFYDWTSEQSIYFKADAPCESWEGSWDDGCNAAIYYNGKRAPQRLFTDGQGVIYELSYDKTYYIVSGCEGWCSEIVIPAEINGAPVTVIGEYVFSGHSEINNIVIPESITQIGWNAFYFWTSYQSIYFESDNPFVNGGDGYNWEDNYCEAAIYYNGKKQPRSWFTDDQGVDYSLSYDKTYYTVMSCQGWCSEIVIPAEIDGVPVTTINSEAFSWRMEIVRIVIPESITQIGWNAFYFWTSYQSIYFESDNPFVNGGDGYNWEDNYCEAAIYYNGKKQPRSRFADEQGITYELSYDKTYYTVSRYEEWHSYLIIIPAEIDGVPVKAIGNDAFAGNSSISSIEIPDSVTSIGWNAFSGWQEYQSIYFKADAPCESWDNYWDNGCDATIYFNGKKQPKNYFTDELGVSYALSYDKTYYTVMSCQGWCSSIVIPGEIDGVPVTVIGDYAFYNCTSLSGIVIPGSVMSIGNYAFGYCESLTSIEIPDSVTSIGYYAFYNCTSLSGIVIPGSVTSIGDYAFSFSTGLRHIVIPESVTYIGWGAFTDWTDEQTIYICAETQPEEWGSGWASDCNARIVWEFVKGDINGDKKVNALDYILTKRHYLNTYTLTDDALVAADLNGNGRIDVTEYVLIKRHCLGTYVIK